MLWVVNSQKKQIGQVKEVYPEGEMDIILYSLSGNLIGRSSPDEGGPTGFEPFCSPDDWKVVMQPEFPIPFYIHDIAGHVGIVDLRVIDLVDQAVSIEAGLDINMEFSESMYSHLNNPESLTGLSLDQFKYYLAHKAGIEFRVRDVIVSFDHAPDAGYDLQALLSGESRLVVPKQKKRIGM